MSDKARACLVLEEAHSLIPEFNSVVAEGDKLASNGTARAILQGRKYGLGCLVVTQRTANVTKSILNQCNTVFALRVFDATGMDFLKNYIGEDYAQVLSTLEERHAVAFGKAISVKEPVLIHLNDRHAFLKIFRESAMAIEESSEKDNAGEREKESQIGDNEIVWPFQEAPPHGDNDIPDEPVIVEPPSDDELEDWDPFTDMAFPNATA